MFTYRNANIYYTRMIGRETDWMTINRRQSLNGADYVIRFGWIGEKKNMNLSTFFSDSL